MKVRITHAPIDAGRSPKSFSESASERLQRTVVGVQGNVRDGNSGMPQLICCSFQQEPSSHGCRRFFDHGSEQPVKLRAALKRLACHILRFRLSGQGVRDNCREAVCCVPSISFIHGRVPHLERIIDKADASRLIVCANLQKAGPKRMNKSILDTAIAGILPQNVSFL